MSGNFARSKGQRGEREVVKLLQPVVNRVYDKFKLEAPQLERNLLQSHKGGCDLVGLDFLAIEVKFQEALTVESWWKQCKTQAIKQSKAINKPVEAILIYRQSRKPWRIVMFGYLATGADRVRCPVDISVEAFLLWFEVALEFQVKINYTESEKLV